MFHHPIIDVIKLFGVQDEVWEADHIIDGIRLQAPTTRLQHDSNVPVPVCQSTCRPVCLSVSLSCCPSTCLSVYLVVEYLPCLWLPLLCQGPSSSAGPEIL